MNSKARERVALLLHDVGLGLRAVGLPAEVALPLRDLVELVEQEDSLALRLGDLRGVAFCGASLPAS